MSVVTGDRELIKKLNKLERRVQTRSIKRASSKAIRPVVQDAKAGARGESKAVAKGIGVRHKMYKKDNNLVSVVGVRNVASVATTRQQLNPFTGETETLPHDPRHIVHLIEGGTKPHMIQVYKNLKVRHPGTKAKPFLEPAMTKNETRIAQIYRETLRSEIMGAVK